jgi:hypothetical protein
MHQHPLFAGYATLEEWAKVADPTQPVYASRMAAPSGHYGEGGPVVYDLSVLVAQPDAQGIVHYCRLKGPP